MNRYFHFHGQLSNFEIVCLSPSVQIGKLRAGLVTQKGKQQLFSNELASSQNLPLLRIDRQKRYYGFFDMFNNSRGVVNRPNGGFLLLTNEYCNSMNEEEWYLLPEAYSITLTPEF